MKKILNIEVTNEQFDNFLLEQETGKEIIAVDGKLFLKSASYYIVKNGELVIDEVAKAKYDKDIAIQNIDFQLDECKKDLLHNETYFDDKDYQSTRDDLLIKIQNLRDERKLLANEN